MNRLNTYKVEGLCKGSIGELKEVQAVNIQAAIDTAITIMDEGFNAIILKAENGEVAAEIHKDGSYTIY